MGRGNTSPHMQSLGGRHIILGTTSLKNWEVWGKRDNLLFVFPLQIKCNNEGKEVLSSLHLSHLLPGSSWM